MADERTEKQKVKEITDKLKEFLRHDKNIIHLPRHRINLVLPFTKW